MTNLETLRAQYLDLINNQLPAIAVDRKFPVRFNHCFARIVLDNLFGDVWYNHLDRKTPAYKQLSEYQLKCAIDICTDIAVRPNQCINQLNSNSLRWRGKLGV